MNILHIFQVVPIDKLMNTRYLYHEQSKKGHIVYILGWSKNNKCEKIQINKNLHVLLLPGINVTSFMDIFNPFIYNLDKYITKLNPDIIHAHQLFKNNTILSTIIAKKHNIPIITTIHGVIAKTNVFMEHLQKIFYYTIGNKMCKLNTKIHCLTNDDAIKMIKYGCESNKIVIIPNGVDTKKFMPKNTESNFSLYWGGRFIPQKGLEYLIKAFEQFSREYPTSKLILSGDGPQLPKIYNLAKSLGLLNKIDFLGRVPFENIPLLINNASICVLPSLMEGMPYSLLEAMSCGKPVVATNISGVKDIISNGKTGLLVPPGNEKDLANSFKMLKEDEDLRKELGKNARKLISEKYDWNSIEKKMYKVYQQMG